MLCLLVKASFEGDCSVGLGETPIGRAGQGMTLGRRHCLGVGRCTGTHSIAALFGVFIQTAFRVKLFFKPFALQ